MNNMDNTVTGPGTPKPVNNIQQEPSLSQDIPNDGSGEVMSCDTGVKQTYANVAATQKVADLVNGLPYQVVPRRSRRPKGVSGADSNASRLQSKEPEKFVLDSLNDPELHSKTENLKKPNGRSNSKRNPPKMTKKKATRRTFRPKTGKLRTQSTTGNTDDIIDDTATSQTKTLSSDPSVKETQTTSASGGDKLMNGQNTGGIRFAPDTGPQELSRGGLRNKEIPLEQPPGSGDTCKLQGGGSFVTLENERSLKSSVPLDLSCAHHTINNDEKSYIELMNKVIGGHASHEELQQIRKIHKTLDDILTSIAINPTHDGHDTASCSHDSPAMIPKQFPSTVMDFTRYSFKPADFERSKNHQRHLNSASTGQDYFQHRRRNTATRYFDPHTNFNSSEPLTQPAGMGRKVDGTVASNITGAARHADGKGDRPLGPPRAFQTMQNSQGQMISKRTSKRIKQAESITKKMQRDLEELKQKVVSSETQSTLPPTPPPSPAALPMATPYGPLQQPYGPPIMPAWQYWQYSNTYNQPPMVAQLSMPMQPSQIPVMASQYGWSAPWNRVPSMMYGPYPGPQIQQP